MDLNYKIKKIIKTNTRLNIAEMMIAIATDPEYGYYSSKYNLRTNKDFITAPEISQLFGEMVGLWCVYNWQQLSEPQEFALVELGPGRGTMMRDILLSSRRVKGFHPAISIHLIEASKALQNIQQLTLMPIAASQNIKLSWHNSISEIPKKPLILVCNEFFDALPIQQYIKLKTKWHEIMLDLNVKTDELYFAYEPVDSRTSNFLNLDYPYVQDGEVVEISTQGIGIIKQISDHIKKFTGAALIVDYGYYRNNRQPNQNYTSTLQAIYEHKFHPLLQNLGEADITSHVDFFNLKEAALVKDVKVKGPISQGEFLQTMGIQLRARSLLPKLPPTQAEQLVLSMERLISAEQMGNLFKVLMINS